MTMGRFVIAAVMLASATAAAAPWSVTPPAGWKDVSAEARTQPGFKQRVDQLAAKGGATELAVYQGDGGGQLTVAYVHMKGESGRPRAIVNAFERGLRKSVQGKDVSYHSTTVGNTFVVEHVMNSPLGPLRSHRLSGVRDGELFSVAAFCTGSAAACEPALTSLALDAQGFESLSGGAADVLGPDHGSDAYQLGYAVGRAIGALLGVVLLVLLFRWLRRRKA